MAVVHRPISFVGPWPVVVSLQLSAMSAIAFFMLAICWSPLLPGLFSIGMGPAFIIAFLLFSWLSIGRRGLNVPILILSVIVVVCCLILFAATGSQTFLNRTIPLAMYIFVAHQTVSIDGLTEAICATLTVYLIVGILLSLVGFGYAYAGGDPSLSVLNPDGRENFLYLTTMSNFTLGNVIRPSFVYDEAGAFSFLICTTVALREMFGKDSRISWFLMLGGLITLSLTHLIIVLMFVVFRLGFIRASILAGAMAAGIMTITQELGDFDFIAERFVIEDGRLTGDNRSIQLENFAKVFDAKIFFFGDVVCHDRPSRACEEHGDISSSPVTPTYSGGIMLLATQIIVHTLLIVAFFRFRNFRFSALTLSILLLQRPYFASFGYAQITLTVLFLMFKARPSRQSG